MNRKSIAFIGTPDYPIPAVKGGAIQTLVTALIDQNEKEQNYDITVYTIADPELNNKKYSFTKLCGIDVSVFGKVRLVFRKVLRRLTNNYISYKSEYMSKVNKELLENNFDYVIFETTDKEIVQLDPLVKQKSKVLYHIHADYISDSIDRIERIAELVDVFIGVSDFISSRLKEVTVLSASKVVTLKNAIAEPQITNEQKILWREKIREQYGLSCTDTVFIYCSRLSPEKGCLELEKALVKLGPSAKLLVVGGENFSSNKKTKYITQLKKVADQNEGRIVFTGAVSHDEVIKYMSAADIAVVPSVCNEASSLTVLEFRACGLPTIATKIGGIPEVVNPDTSVLVEYGPKFVEELAAAMDNVINNKTYLESLQHGSSKNMSQFFYRKYYQNFVELLNKIEQGEY